MELAIKNDVLNLATDQVNDDLIEMTDPEIPQRVKAKQALQQMCCDRVPEVLPLPLSCMNKKQKIIWVTREMLHQQRAISGKILNNVVYGDKNLMPNFWLDEEWDWLELKRNLSNITNEMFTGSGEFHDFLTKLIENCLGLHGKRGDLHYDKNVDPQTIQKKMKRKGVHQEAQILSVNTENQIDENENVDVGGEGQEENVYRVPLNSNHPSLCLEELFQMIYKSDPLVLIHILLVLQQ